MRARLHVRNGTHRFLRENTHSLCDAGPTGQFLRADTVAILERLAPTLPASVSEIELWKHRGVRARRASRSASGADVSRLAAVVRSTGSAARRAPTPRTRARWICSARRTSPDAIGGVTLHRHVRSFFQGNRFLTPSLVDHVLSSVDAGPAARSVCGASGCSA
jgi:hypothetical protein